jgi:hydrogenase maturation protease
MTEVCPARVLVIGIGNPDRGDDGCAAAVITRLQASTPPGVVLRARNGDILALLDEWDGFDTVILIDAAAPVARPGQVHRLDLTAGPLLIGSSQPSTHAFGLGETVELARNLGRLPRRFVLYLVEGESFAAGGSLSPAVAAATDRMAESIRFDIARLLQVDQRHGASIDA